MIYLKNKISLPIILILLFGEIAFGQSRSTINDGVEKYEKGDFVGASENFQRSIEEKFENYKGHFNLGDALYKQEKYEDALNSYKNALTLAETDEQKAEVYHNIGNTMLKTQKLKEAIGSYTESLKLNPKDLETKYNLSYALKQMQQQQKNQDKNKDKNDKNKDDKKEKNKDQKKDQDKKDDQKDKNDKQDQKNKDQQDDKKDENSTKIKRKTKDFIKPPKNNDVFYIISKEIAIFSF
jgi:tetratricopeptide (TPR) repeat protein